VAFSDNFLQELVERNDIVDVVSGYVRFTKKSGSNQFGLCPFHSEKTPSFSVSADKQIYHCFGCGKGGGVINFIMDVENLSFPESVEFLAKRVGMTMPETVDTKEGRKRERLLLLNKEAARFYYNMLQTPEGQIAKNYMLKRGIDKATATKFGLGFAPDSWDSLRNAMRKQGFTDQEIFDCGLIRQGKNGGFYDLFRNRLMFPVIDVRGNVIGFSGRRLDAEKDQKYVNSPETLVYNKSRNLFGLNLAKKSKAGNLILCEGNIDVVSMHQAGFDSAVASLGTALTDEQARLISRYTKEVVIAYDNDGAGQKASERAIKILEKLDVNVKVLKMTGAKDPDEFIKANGKDAFSNLVNESENQIDYRINSVKAKYDISNAEQKVAYLKEVTDLISKLPGEVERQVYSMSVASETGVSKETVENEVKRKRKNLVSGARKKAERSMHPESEIQPQKKEFKYSNSTSAVAEEGVIRLLFLDPGLFTGREGPWAADFSSPELSKIYTIMREKVQNGESVAMASLSESLEPSETALLATILQKPEDLSRGRYALDDYCRVIKEQSEIPKGSSDLLALANKLRETKGYQ